MSVTDRRCSLFETCHVQTKTYKSDNTPNWSIRKKVGEGDFGPSGYSCGLGA